MKAFLGITDFLGITEVVLLVKDRKVPWPTLRICVMETFSKHNAVTARGQIWNDQGELWLRVEEDQKEKGF